MLEHFEKTAISVALIETAFTSEYVPCLFENQGTHEDALKFVAQLVPHTQDKILITQMIAGCLPTDYTGNTIDEIPGMVDGAIRKGLHTRNRRTKKSSDKKISEQCLELVKQKNVALFHDPQMEGFISIPQEAGGFLHHAIRSEVAKRWLRFVYYEERGKPIAPQSLVEVIETLEAKALFESPCHEIHIRIGGLDDSVYIDLGGLDGHVVHITPDGWSVTTDCPLKFYRLPGFGELPEPKHGGNLESLKKLFNLSPENWIFLLAFLVNALQPTGPYMCLLVEGEQGSGKSLLCTIVKRIIDPNAVDKLRLPKNEHDLMIQAKENSLLVYDNASGIKWNISDSLCSLATGSGYKTRRYYTDNDSRTFQYSRAFVINGIGEYVRSPDLLERAIPLKLPSMPAGSRKTESDIISEFKEILPGILGCLFDIVARALKFVDKTETPTSIRMADSARWLAAAEGACGLPEDTFVNALERGQTDLMTDSVVNDPLTIGLVEIVKRSPFEGMVGELFEELKNNIERYDRRYPPTASHLSNSLKRLKPALAKVGIQIEFGNKSRRGKLIKIWMEDQEASGDESNDSSGMKI